MTDFDSVKDSGERQEWETGSRRDTRDGKGRYDLIPPLFMHRLARHLENGAVKYGDKNWELGQPLSRYLDSALRHTYKVLDLAVDEDHPAAGVWNLMAFLCTAEWIREGRLPRDLDDIGYCDALDERDEDAALPYAYDSDRWEQDYDADEPGGRPAKQWTPEDVVAAETVVDIAGDPTEQTTVLTDAGGPESEGWVSGPLGPDSWFTAYVGPVNADPVPPLGPEWVDIGYMTERPEIDTSGIPHWVPSTISFEAGPIERETLDILTGARFLAGPPAETTDLADYTPFDSTGLAPFIQRVNEITRALAEQAWPIRYVAGVGTEETMQALKDKTTHEVPAARPHLQGDVSLFGLPLYEVDADDPILGGQPWAIVPQSWAQQAVQRSLDRD